MEISNALWITLIGMSLVFVAILLLWGLMALLVRVTAEKEGQAPLEEEAEEVAPEHVAIPDAALLSDRKRRAAAAAVAAAMALSQTGQKGKTPLPGARRGGGLSPWQVVNRANQINQIQTASRKKVAR